jgi:trimeric autotransporter adhesin
MPLTRRQNLQLVLVTLAFSVALSGCGGGTGSTPPSASTYTLSMSWTSGVLPQGSSKQISLTAHYSGGGDTTVTDEATWTSSAKTVATVSNGLVKAVGTGTAVITANLNGNTATAKVTVSSATISSISINPSPLSLALGTGQQMSAVATYSNGTTQDVTPTATWSSSASSVAQVSKTGFVQSETTGPFQITATVGQTAGSLNGVVNGASPTSISITPSSSSLPKGAMQSFTANAHMTNSTTQNVTASTAWQSSNTSVATISSNGTLTAVGPGSTIVTGNYRDFSSTASVTVSNSTVTAIVVTPIIASAAKGTTVQFSANATISNGSMQNLTNAVSWVASPTAVCTVGAGGLATAVSPGICAITASSSGVSGNATLTVTSANLVSITLSPSTLSVAIGQTEQITATGSFSDGTTQNITSTASFTSSNPAVATISAAGVLQGVATGGANITATSGSVHVTQPVLVTAATLQSIAISPSTLSIAAGTNQQLTATATFSDGSTQNVTSTLNWVSSAPTVANVSSSGLVSALASGDATITGTSGTISATLTLSVTPAQVVSISLTPASINLAIGQSQNFSATAAFTDGTTQDVTESAGWSVANPALAGVSNTLGLAGQLTGLAAGTTTVSAALNGVSGSASVTVNPAVLTTITVTPSSLSLALGLSSSLTATGVFSDGSTQNLTTSAAWSSSNPTVLTISASGAALPIAVGTVTVNATIGSVSGSASVTVTAATLRSIQLSASQGSLAAGLSESVTATGTYSDGSIQNINGSVQWTSSSPAVATVSAAGVALAIAPGSTTITATLNGVSATLELNVSQAVLQSITVTAPSSSFALGFNLQLTATGTYSDGSTQNLTGSVSWTSSNSGIAVVSNAGLLAGVAVGEITAAASLQGVTGSLSITVNAATLMSVAITPSNVSLQNLLTTQQFTLTGTFSDGSTQPLTNSASWASSNPLFGLISTTGLLTPVAVGDFNVTATYQNLTATASVSIL